MTMINPKILEQKLMAITNKRKELAENAAKLAEEYMNNLKNRNDITKAFEKDDDAILADMEKFNTEYQAAMEKIKPVDKKLEIEQKAIETRAIPKEPEASNANFPYGPLPRNIDRSFKKFE
ncbi:MAG: hypothetical protein MJ180_05070 [Candidatus Gastranaerophilales bacterium]|nr:hypothetical protein [Candidatus Gastranaerophilales bacterium]